MVKHLYKKFKCETAKEYFQRMHDIPAKYFFNCELAMQLYNMRSHLNFSQEKEQFLCNVQTFHCSYNLLLFLYISNFLVVAGIIFPIMILLYFKRQTIQRSLPCHNFKVSPYVEVAIIFALLLLLMLLSSYYMVDILLSI